MRRSMAALVMLLAGIPLGVAAQGAQDTVRLTLQEALARAAREGEEMRLARSQIDLANAQIRNARATALPQLNTSFGYTRTFASQFDTGESFTIPDSLKFEPDS